MDSSSTPKCDDRALVARFSLPRSITTRCDRFRSMRRRHFMQDTWADTWQMTISTRRFTVPLTFQDLCKILARECKRLSGIGLVNVIIRPSRNTNEATVRRKGNTSPLDRTDFGYRQRTARHRYKSVSAVLTCVCRSSSCSKYARVYPGKAVSASSSQSAPPAYLPT
jgi:hypothetical protein